MHGLFRPVRVCRFPTPKDDSRIALTIAVVFVEEPVDASGVPGYPVPLVMVDASGSRYGECDVGNVKVDGMSEKRRHV